jgi:hypothetical protein
MYYRVTQKEGERSYLLRSNHRGKNNVILSNVRINLKVTVSYKQSLRVFLIAKFILQQQNNTRCVTTVMSERVYGIHGEVPYDPT